MAGFSFTSRTQRLPRHLTHAIKTTALEAVLHEAGLDIAAAIDRNATGLLLEISLRPPHRCGESSFLWMRSGAVPASRASEARAFVQGTVLPQFRDWVTFMVAQPMSSPWRREPQSYAWQLGPASAVTASPDR